MASSIPSQPPSEESSDPMIAETADASNSSSAVPELQEAFGGLLLARNKKFDYVSFWERYHQTANQAIKHKWTGVFELFAFPRELRDRIYYHYLPDGPTFNRNTLRRFPCEDPGIVTNLFLASKQVHDEAYQVLCRYSNLQIANDSSCNRSLLGTLRMFPTEPAKMLQRVGKKYFHRRWMNYWYPDPSPGETWTRMLRDAYIFKLYFPRLREFTAVWEMWPEELADISMRFKDETEEEKVEMWLTFMRQWMETKSVVPPPWLRVVFRTDYSEYSMRLHQASMEEAYKRLLQETAPSRDIEKELEETARRCAEDMLSVGNNKRSGKKKHLQSSA